MKFYTHISSTTPCTLSINGTNTYKLINPNFSWIDIFSKQDFFVSFFPNESNIFMPTSTKALSNTPIDIIKIPYINNHLELIYNPHKILTSKNDIIVLEKKVGDVYIKITNNGKTFINILNKNQQTILNKEIPDLLNITDEVSSYYLLQGITKHNTYYVVIIDLNNNSLIFEDEFNIIESDSKNIKLLKFDNDLSQHGTVYIFDKKLHKYDNYAIYKNNKPNIVAKKELIPLAFLECIKLNDITLAKHYLKDNFVSNEHITSFFGKITNIFFNCYETNKLNYTVQTNEYKSYNFEIENNKISDIEEVKI